MNPILKRQIIASIATAHGVTPEEVQADLEAAILAGMESDDPSVKREWMAICPDGQTPTVDMVLAYILGRCLAKLSIVGDMTDGLMNE